jgi:hypothetical protein
LFFLILKLFLGTVKLLSTPRVVWLGLKNLSFHFYFTFWFVDSIELLLVLRVAQGGVLNPNSSSSPKKDLSLSSSFFVLRTIKLLSMPMITQISCFLFGRNH